MPPPPAVFCSPLTQKHAVSPGFTTKRPVYFAPRLSSRPRLPPADNARLLQSDRVIDGDGQGCEQGRMLFQLDAQFACFVVHLFSKHSGYPGNRGPLSGSSANILGGIDKAGPRSSVAGSLPAHDKVRVELPSTSSSGFVPATKCNIRAHIASDSAYPTSGQHNRQPCARIDQRSPADETQPVSGCIP